MLLERYRSQSSKGAILLSTGPADYHSLALEAFSLAEPAWVSGAYLGADMTAAAGFIDRTANGQPASM
ncbi:hypothetical protein BH20ACT22_BH20ACT22_20270 [soil metagenome]